MPNIASMCCGGPVVMGTVVDYPLGGRTWGVPFLVDVCDVCGKEAETVHTCENCGAELNGDNPEIPGMDRCYICVGEDGGNDQGGMDAALQPDEFRPVAAI